ncbi:MAG: PDZ domain-containing protein, partial [Candidatus Cloacimonadales bacterium]|nr:PDZ domain-containing protein [Candidatus Cloacimonadales bacterium]
MKNYLNILLLIFSIFIIQCTTDSVPINKLKISSFVEVSSLEKAGAQAGDIILKYNGKTVRSQDHLMALKEKVTSEMVDMVLLRDNKKIKLQVPIG